MTVYVDVRSAGAVYQEIGNQIRSMSVLPLPQSDQTLTSRYCSRWEDEQSTEGSCARSYPSRSFGHCDSHFAQVRFCRIESHRLLSSHPPRSLVSLPPSSLLSQKLTTSSQVESRFVKLPRSRETAADSSLFTAIEQQAFDRSHRFGQTEDVVIYKLTIENTVEDRLLELQAKKSATAASALDGGDHVKSNKVRSLFFLFSSALIIRNSSRWRILCSCSVVMATEEGRRRSSRAEQIDLIILAFYSSIRKLVANGIRITLVTKSMNQKSHF